MEITEAIKQRRSIRAFKPDAVPQQTLKELLELSLRAPSWTNTQPWEFAVVTGSNLAEIRNKSLQNAGHEATPDVGRPSEFPEPYNTRRRTIGSKLFSIRGIAREDKEKRGEWRRQGSLNFGAPCVIYIYIDRSLYSQGNITNVWPVFDCGLVAANVMLLAPAYGLGTIPQAQAADYPDMLRNLLRLPSTKIILLGIAIGYPDWSDPINQFCSERDPVESVAGWWGFI